MKNYIQIIKKKVSRLYQFVTMPYSRVYSFLYITLGALLIFMALFLEVMVSSRLLDIRGSSFALGLIQSKDLLALEALMVLLSAFTVAYAALSSFSYVKRTKVNKKRVQNSQESMFDASEYNQSEARLPRPLAVFLIFPLAFIIGMVLSDMGSSHLREKIVDMVPQPHKDEAILVSVMQYALDRGFLELDDEIVYGNRERNAYDKAFFTIFPIVAMSSPTVLRQGNEKADALIENMLLDALEDRERSVRLDSTKYFKEESAAYNQWKDLVISYSDVYKNLLSTQKEIESIDLRALRSYREFVSQYGQKHSLKAYQDEAINRAKSFLASGGKNQIDEIFKMVAGIRNDDRRNKCLHDVSSCGYSIKKKIKQLEQSIGVQEPFKQLDILFYTENDHKAAWISDKDYKYLDEFQKELAGTTMHGITETFLMAIYTRGLSLVAKALEGDFTKLKGSYTNDGIVYKYNLAKYYSQQVSPQYKLFDRHLQSEVIWWERSGRLILERELKKLGFDITLHGIDRIDSPKMSQRIKQYYQDVIYPKEKHKIERYQSELARLVSKSKEIGNGLNLVEEYRQLKGLDKRFRQAFYHAYDFDQFEDNASFVREDVISRIESRSFNLASVIKSELDSNLLAFLFSEYGIDENSHKSDAPPNLNEIALQVGIFPVIMVMIALALLVFHVFKPIFVDLFGFFIHSALIRWGIMVLVLSVLILYAVNYSESDNPYYKKGSTAQTILQDIEKDDTFKSMMFGAGFRVYFVLAPRLYINLPWLENWLSDDGLSKGIIKVRDTLSFHWDDTIL